MKSHLRITIDTLLKSGTSHRQIARRTGVDRKTIRAYAASLGNSPGVATGFAGLEGQMPPPRPPALEGAATRLSAAASTSACEAHRTWIEAQVTLGRNAMSIYQDLVEAHGFAHSFNSVKRFVGTLKARAPERFDVLEFLPGVESQVDYGQGAPTHLKLLHLWPGQTPPPLRWDGWDFSWMSRAWQCARRLPSGASFFLRT